MQVPGGSNRQNYADVNLIIQLAIKHKCDAIWPGWGHASENPALPLAAAEVCARCCVPLGLACAAQRRSTAARTCAGRTLTHLALL